MVLVATFQGTHCQACTRVRMGCTLLLYLVKAQLLSLKPVYAGRFIACNLLLIHSTVMFFRATPLMRPTKGRFLHSATLASALHSPVLVSQTVWPIRTSVPRSVIRCKITLDTGDQLTVRKSIQHDSSIPPLYPIVFLLRTSICSLCCPGAIHWRSGIIHGIPLQAHLYFKPAFIVASFLCLLLSTLP